MFGPQGEFFPFAIGSRGYGEERRTVRRLGLHIQAKKQITKKKDSDGNERRESAESSVHFLCRLDGSVKAVNSARLQSVWGLGGIRLPGDVNIPRAPALRWGPVCQVQLWVASL